MTSGKETWKLFQVSFPEKGEGSGLKIKDSLLDVIILFVEAALWKKILCITLAIFLTTCSAFQW